MELKIEKYNPGSQIPNLKMWIYGESGVGKTVLASTFPDPLFLDMDNGMVSVDKQVYRAPLSSWEEVVALVEYMHSNPEQFAFAKTIVVDSLNELQRLSMQNVLESYPQKRPYDSLPSQGDYGKMLVDFESVVRDLLLLPKMVILISTNTNRLFEDETIQPMLTGKSTAKILAAKMDVVGYMYKAQDAATIHRVIAFDSPNALTKDRTRKLPKQILNPTWETIHKFLEVNNGNQS